MIVPILSECLRIVEDLLRPENTAAISGEDVPGEGVPASAGRRVAGVAKLLVWYALAVALGLGLARLGA